MSPTRCVRLTVISEVIEVVTHGLHGNLGAPPPRVADKQEVRFFDATGSGTDRSLPIHLHSNVCDGAAVFKGDGRSVAPAA